MGSTPFRIGFLPDSTLPAQKGRGLVQTVNHLRHLGQVDLLKADLTELEVLNRIEKERYDLLLLPWRQYLEWNKVEAYFGTSRKGGPSSAGYFADAVALSEFEKLAPGISNHNHLILFDFYRLEPKEIRTFVGALLDESRRVGIAPLIGNDDAKIYRETWLEPGFFGPRMNTIMEIPELQNPGWKPRSNAIRLCLTALWSFVYEEGPGKGDLTQAIAAHSARATFQMSVSDRMAIMHLCLTLPQWNAKEVKNYFSPQPGRPLSSAQIVERYSDFLRIHAGADHAELEITLALTANAPSLLSPDALHTLWIEPLSEKWMSQALLPNDSPRIQSFPSSKVATLTIAPNTPPPSDDATSKLYRETLEHLKALRSSLVERENEIELMKAGGVGVAKSTTPPGPLELLEAFHERYLFAQDEIDQIKKQLADAEVNGLPIGQRGKLKARLEYLIREEKDWIKQLSETIQEIKNKKKQTG